MPFKTYRLLSVDLQRNLINELCTRELWAFVCLMLRFMHRIPFAVRYVPSWVGEYQLTVLKQRKRIVTLLALKRRRIHAMGHLDRFLIRELALVVWASR
jgi:hypothetical protein